MIKTIFRHFKTTSILRDPVESKVLKATFDVNSIKDLPFNENIELAWKQLIPYKIKLRNTDTPVLFLHGLFGSKLSFNKIGRLFSELTRVPTYSLDLRNHGESPHVLPHTYSQMAHDVHNFIKERKWDQCVLVGHSMGAKVAMLISLLYPELISKLVVVDNTPHNEPLDDQFKNDLLGMCEVELNGAEYKKGENGKRVTEVKDINKFLSKYQKDPISRSLLMSNLIITQKDYRSVSIKDKKKEVFKVPVMNFWKHDIIDAMGAWPKLPSNIPKFENPVLIMYGIKSNFVKKDNFEIFKKYFTNLKFEEFDTGHWISVEKPKEFLNSLIMFISPPSSRNYEDPPKRKKVSKKMYRSKK
ncbi:uncharacterized protein KGF55_005633 [Candida pseudojiufengensis]|uniref:uncharacterized protein n=1 Tax=Candida pseudojiufengensis TaxID=497109 RepID=UPI0022240E66|nr:uncharacterized protein KGF55_005633 [Candida pseudojiufengensis]KAI5958979.1 hypothetical protein KGF55_005633 [Candida pseudojiufengensis]